jgi:MarR family transcriptional regulator, lower aerobic nicotinate degradation pathway regulator
LVAPTSSGTLVGMETAAPRHPPTLAAPALVRTKTSWLLNQAANTANRLVAERLASVQSRRYHFLLLAALAEEGPASQAELSRRTTIDGSDMVATVNELTERGLVKRAPDLSDRRRNVVTLTAAGRRHLRRLDSLLDRSQDDLLAPLSLDERQQLVDLLARVVGHHSRA